jgi:hypothetical protein
VVVRQFELDLHEDFDAFTTISRFCFTEGPSIATVVDLPGFITEVVFAATVNDNMRPLPADIEIPTQGMITTPPSHVLVRCNLHKFANIIYDTEGTHSRLQFFNLPTGFVCLVKTTTLQQHKQAVYKLN